MIAASPGSSRRRPLRCLGGAVLGIGLALGTAAVLGAQMPKIESFSLDDGLPSSSVNALARDPSGRLWIALRSGLAVYDGRSFDTVEGPAPTTEVGALTVDAEGRLWIAARWAGPRVYRSQGRGVERRGWHPLPVPPSPLPVSGGSQSLWEISALVVRDAGESVAVGSPSAGLWLWDGHGWSHQGVGGGLPSGQVAALAAFGERLAIGTRAGLCFLAGDEIDCALAVREPRLAEPVLALTRVPCDPSQLWLLTSSAVGFLRDGLFTVVADFQSPVLARSARGALAVDTSGGLYFGFRGLAFFRDPESRRVAVLGRSTGLLSDGMTAVLTDRESNVWVGSTRGLSKIESRRFLSYDESQGLFEDEVASTLELRPGEILLGHNNGLTFLRDGIADGTLRLARPAVDQPGLSRVLDMTIDGDGSVWLAASELGLIRLDAGRRPHEVAFPAPSAVSVEIDARGRLWVAGRHHVFVRSAAETTFTRVDPGRRDAGNLRWLTAAADGRLFVATDRGLLWLEDGRWRLAHGPSPESDNVYGVLPGDAGDVWVGTGGGLFRLRGEELVPVSRGPVVGDPVYFILADRRGHLWLGTDNGVVVWDGERSRRFAVRQGLAGLETNRGAALVDHAGRVWIGTDRGVSLYQPHYDRKRPTLPVVELEALAVDGHRLPAAEDVRLGHRQNNLVFHVATISFSRQQDVALRYRLEGFDTGWQRLASPISDEVRYTNVPPGSYRFRAAVGLGDGRWSPEATSAAIVIARPLWRNPWLFVTGFVLTVGAGFGVQGLRIRRARRRAAELESLNRKLNVTIAELERAKADRERLIDDLEVKNFELERFNYTVSHDLKTPLFTILGFLGLLETDAEAGDRERLRQDVEQIGTAARTMGRLLDELLELSRIGRVVGPPARVDLGDLAREAVALSSGRLTERGVEVDVADGLPVAHGDRGRLLEVFQNLIENAVKFLGDEPAPRIEIGARRQDGETVCYVRDNGIGIEPRYHRLVFELFERLDADQEGTGIGLALVRRIVEIHGGRAWVESQGQGQGATFCFTLGAES